MADTGAKPPARWVGWARHPADLPQGLPHASPGAEPRDARNGLVEGCPRAAARSGSARPTGCPTTSSVKIVGDYSELMTVWTLYGHKTHPDNPKRPQTTSVCNRENRR